MTTKSDKREVPERLWIYPETLTVSGCNNLEHITELTKVDIFCGCACRFLVPDAATRMRERCVSELNSLLLEYELERQERTEDEGKTHRIVRAAVLAMQRAIARVESLTLDGEKEQ